MTMTTTTATVMEKICVQCNINFPSNQECVLLSLPRKRNFIVTIVKRYINNTILKLEGPQKRMTKIKLGDEIKLLWGAKKYIICRVVEQPSIKQRIYNFYLNNNLKK